MSAPLSWANGRCLLPVRSCSCEVIASIYSVCSGSASSMWSLAAGPSQTKMGDFLNSTFAPNKSLGPYRCQFNEDFKYILLPVSYGLVFVVGLVLNAVTLYVILFRTRSWTSSTIYMFNLTVCDTLYILTLPFLVYYYADENDWPFGEALCKLIRFLFYANLYGSILFLCCISLHRFLGICYPVHSLGWVSTRRARLVSACVWLIVGVFQAPVLYFSRTHDDGTGVDRTCYDTTSEDLFDDFMVYTTAVSVLLFALPFMVLMVCYGLMVRKLLEPTQVGEGMGSSRCKQKSVKMIIIVLAVFMLCFLPFFLTRSLYYSFRYLDEQISCSQLESASIAYKVTRPLASANSCLDPVLYFMAGQGFRRKITRRTKSRTPQKVKTLSTQL
ncbi:P2Y purinoceptor 2-like isoform X2 [Alosa sapidissima]|uniref:P2Y purinoceptor 2-like isoform X2 n=1 Tax=Alosa sapidissima TaxID=34773 RepID=UPI001C07FF88|nr:P2Y purinoceptor 2-like isoform X2 [Alosa sapidissima]XP_041919658.1 P2Y purinoceptor 2-like isoform X2 [Alosa sapidissima]